MPQLTHFNPTSGSPPYKSLFSNVTIVPPNTSLAYISTQWAADPATGELIAGTENDYAKQLAIIYKNIVSILKELGVTIKDVVHRTVQFKDFDDEIGKTAAMAVMDSMPDDWKADAFSSSLTYSGVAHFHRPGVVCAVDLVVAVVSK